MLDQRTSIPARTHDCQPWCTDHANGTPPSRSALPEDQICRRVVSSPAFGEILATYCMDDGAVVRLYNARDEMNLGEAEQFAYAVLAQVAAIRSAVTA